MTESDDRPGVRLEVQGAVARITLDRPAQHNALRVTEVEALLGLFDRVDADNEVRVVILTGAGSATFCSGASLLQMQSGEMSGELFDTLTDRLARLRAPTICRLAGSLYGGGAELALCCDFRVGVDGIRLSVPAARLGVCYPLGGLSRYVRRLGLGAAARILIGAEELDAHELHRIGFLSHRVTPERLEETVDALAERIASLAPLAVRSMKSILIDIARDEVDREAVARLVARCADSRDLREGLAAWREGREPSFEGK